MLAAHGLFEMIVRYEPYGTGGGLFTTDDLRIANDAHPAKED